nr:hypothetical protein Itr_chr10CG00990 [Ipomoea trifida]
MVLLLHVHELLLLHAVWNDARCTNSRGRVCCHLDDFLPHFLEPLLRLPHSKNTNSSVVEMVLLGNTYFMDNLRASRVAVRG